MMNRYEKYKDSSIPWIGEIPQEWEVCSIKQIMKNKSVRNYPNEKVLSLYRDYGVVPKDSRNDNHNVTSEDTSSYKFVEKGDFVLNKMKAWQGSMAVSDYQGIISPAYYICQFVKLDTVKRFVHYLLRNEAYKTEYMRLSTGLRIGQWDLNINDFLSIKMISPKPREQQAIADFLDVKCGQVDELITLQEKMIDELKVYKQSVITEAVTKGLNPDAPLKDSGIEWIGQIPMHWKIVPFKTTYRLTKGLTITKADLVENGVPVISYGQIHSKLNTGTNISDSLIRYVPESFITDNSNSLVCKRDIIFADTSEDLEGCGNCVYIDREMVLFAGYHTIIAKNIFGLSSKYIAYLFKTDCWRYQLRTSVNGVKLFSISQKILANTSVILPSEIEQQQIADYLDTKCAEIDEMTSIKQQKIEQLKEYKKSIIYEYVTGKKQVNF